MNDFVLVQGMDDTKRALRRWNERPWEMLRPWAGLSLLISPPVNGLLSDAFGAWRERHGRSRSYLATFWGGALFAFGMAGARFLFLNAR